MNLDAEPGIRLSLAHGGAEYVNMTVQRLAAAGVPGPAIDAALSAAVTAAAHERLRALAATVFSASAAQGAIYDAKYAEAKAYVAANRPANPGAGAYPFLSAEAPARGMTRSALADLIIETGDAWRACAAQIEAARVAASAGVAAAVGEAAKQAAAEAAIAPAAAAVAALG